MINYLYKLWLILSNKWRVVLFSHGWCSNLTSRFVALFGFIFSYMKCDLQHVRMGSSLLSYLIVYSLTEVPVLNGSLVQLEKPWVESLPQILKLLRQLLLRFLNMLLHIGEVHARHSWTVATFNVHNLVDNCFYSVNIDI